MKTGSGKSRITHATSAECQINRIDQELVVNFEERAVEYDFGDLDELSLAYALSIHKSQGSEFPCVVIPVHTDTVCWS